jgi:hypothetical protein
MVVDRSRKRKRRRAWGLASAVPALALAFFSSCGFAPSVAAEETRAEDDVVASLLAVVDTGERHRPPWLSESDEQKPAFLTRSLNSTVRNAG